MSDKDIIYRQDAIKYFTELWECIQNINDREEWEDVCTTTVNEIKSAEPRQKGKWIANGDIHKECPFCGEDWDKYVFGEVWYTDELPKFCPNCGADMREGEEE